MPNQGQGRFVKSGFVQVVSRGDSAVVWHSLFGEPQVVSQALLAVLDLFSSPRSFESLAEEFEVTDEIQGILDALIVKHFLIPPGFDERRFLAEQMSQREGTITDGSLIDYLELIISEACNFRCSYCIHFNNLETSTRLDAGKRIMKFEVAKEAVDGFLATLRHHGKTVAEINFGGGEPLLAWSVVAQVLEYCRSQYGSEFAFRFSINTNATLITPEIARTLKENKVAVATSLDGLREGNDSVRRMNGGKGTFDAIVRGYDTLAAAGYPIDGFAVTVNEKNFPYLTTEIIDWAVRRGMTEVRIDIDVIGMVDVLVADIVTRLMEIRRYARQYSVEVPGFWSRPAENLNHSTLDTHVAFCGAVRGNSACVSPLGNIYSCGYSTTRLGTLTNISNLYSSDSDYADFVRNHLTGAIEMCKGCLIEGQCGGGCNITHEFAGATHAAKFDRMCDFYRSMTKELLLEQLQEFTENTRKGGESDEAEGVEEAPRGPHSAGAAEA